MSASYELWKWLKSLWYGTLQQYGGLAGATMSYFNPSWIELELGSGFDKNALFNHN